MDFEQTSMIGTDTTMQGFQELGALFARGSSRKVGELFRGALPSNELTICSGCGWTRVSVVLRPRV